LLAGGVPGGAARLRAEGARRGRDLGQARLHRRGHRSAQRGDPRPGGAPPRGRVHRPAGPAAARRRHVRRLLPPERCRLCPVRRERARGPRRDELSGGLPMLGLPEPETLECYFDAGFAPPLAAMRLHWPEAPRRPWLLPGELRLTAPPPGRFGITVLRRGLDAYEVYLLWDQTRLCWPALGGAALMASSLPALLRLLGTDLEYLLSQPVLSDGAPGGSLKAA